MHKQPNLSDQHEKTLSALDDGVFLYEEKPDSSLPPAQLVEQFNSLAYVRDLAIGDDFVHPQEYAQAQAKHWLGAALAYKDHGAEYTAEERAASPELSALDAGTVLRGAADMVDEGISTITFAREMDEHERRWQYTRWLEIAKEPHLRELLSPSIQEQTNLLQDPHFILEATWSQFHVAHARLAQDHNLEKTPETRSAYKANGQSLLEKTLAQADGLLAHPNLTSEEYASCQRLIAQSVRDLGALQGDDQEYPALEMAVNILEDVQSYVRSPQTTDDPVSRDTSEKIDYFLNEYTRALEAARATEDRTRELGAASLRNSLIQQHAA